MATSRCCRRRGPGRSRCSRRAGRWIPTQACSCRESPLRIPAGVDRSHRAGLARRRHALVRGDENGVREVGAGQGGVHLKLNGSMTEDITAPVSVAPVRLALVRSATRTSLLRFAPLRLAPASSASPSSSGGNGGSLMTAEAKNTTPVRFASVRLASDRSVNAQSNDKPPTQPAREDPERSTNERLSPLRFAPSRRGARTVGEVGRSRIETMMHPSTTMSADAGVDGMAKTGVTSATAINRTVPVTRKRRPATTSPPPIFVDAECYG